MPGRPDAYHLGLAHYLRGELDDAIAAYHACMAASKNDDMVVATSYWLYLALRRAGHDADARAVLDAIDAGMTLIENTSYHQLLLLYKGELPAGDLLRDAGDDALENATVGYGVAQWHALEGRAAEARRALERVVAGPQWAAFGYVAAEADLSRRCWRMGSKGPRGGVCSLESSQRREAHEDEAPR